MNTTVPTAAQIAQNLKRAARVIAPVIALVLTYAVLLAELAYNLGIHLARRHHDPSIHRLV
jgi:hypothetical protein